MRSVWPLGRAHSSGFIDHCPSCPRVTLDGPEAKLSGGRFCYCYVKFKGSAGACPTAEKHTGAFLLTGFLSKARAPGVPCFD